MLGLNLTKYSSQIKILSFIPVLVGLLSFSEAFLPEKKIETLIVSKKEDYRAKFNNTTYNIYFENNNDQFTEEIFNAFNEGDEVVIYVSYFTEETSRIINKKTRQSFENSTYEVYIKYLLAIIFLIPAIFWFKNKSLSSKQSKYLLFIIIFSLLSFYRIIKLNIT